jgi:hypothetical protein
MASRSATSIYPLRSDIQASQGGPAPVTNSGVAYGQTTLPSGIRSRFVDTHTGVTLPVLEAGPAAVAALQHSGPGPARGRSLRAQHPR